MLDNILVHEQDSAPPYKMFYGQDVKYANHLQTFGEICVTMETSNEVGRLKLDTRGRLCMFMGYSTQHAGDVYRFLHMLGKLWHELYHIPSIHSADKCVDPFDDYIEETGTNQEVEENIQETEQMPAIIEDMLTNEGKDELIPTRT